MPTVHLVMPFSRFDLAETLREAYRPMGAIWHPILFADEVQRFPCREPWIQPYIIPGNAPKPDPTVAARKVNAFILNFPILITDYYVTVADDDCFEPDVFAAIGQESAEVVVISMKRGHNIPSQVSPIRAYETSTLTAAPEHMRIGQVSGEQLFVRGDIFRRYLFEETSLVCDGQMAEQLAGGHRCVYRPDLFALFNYFEAERWERPKIGFGAMVNHWARVDMALKQSEISGQVRYINEPESATKGLNKLLGILEADGCDVAVLAHQDMSFRRVWLPQIRRQLKRLPDSWITAGIIGKDLTGRICGVFQDTRIPLIFNTIDIHTFPHPATCYDECCILVNLHKGFRFDEGLDGFDLYGTLAVLQSWAMGGTAWIIDSGAIGARVQTPVGEVKADIAYALHHCTRPFTWEPDEDFRRRFKWLWEKYDGLGKIDSTVFAVPKEQLRFETSAA